MLIGFYGTVLSTTNEWKIHNWSYSDVLKLNKEVDDNNYKVLIENIAKNFKITEDYKVIEEKFLWKYPYETSTRLPSKITVTELKRLGDEASEDIFEVLSNQMSEKMDKLELLEKPSYMEENLYSGAKFGTLLHNVMQRIDFEKYNLDEVIDSVEDTYKKKVKYYLEQFLNTNLYNEIKNAKNIWKEMPFNLSMKTSEIYSGIQDLSVNDEILIQGVIDLYFENQEGDIILVDYKTDHIDSEEEFINRYKTQLDYYKKALENLTQKKVKKVIIYSFNLNKEIELK